MNIHMAPANHTSSGTAGNQLTLATVLASWENDDKDRYYPLDSWNSAEQRVIVAVRDGGFGTLRDLCHMTLAEAIATGMSATKHLTE